MTPTQRRGLGLLLAAATALALAGCDKPPDTVTQAEKKDKVSPGIAETKAIAEEAYVYGFPMIAAYRRDSRRSRSSAT